MKADNQYTKISVPDSTASSPLLVQNSLHDGNGFLATEWGQDSALSTWFKQPAQRQFGTRWKLAPDQTNDAYGQACLQKPVMLEQWNDFVATAPLDPNFIAESYRFVCRHGVMLSAYYSYGQYARSRSADLLTTLYATNTVAKLNGRYKPHSLWLEKHMAVSMRTRILEKMYL